MQEVVHARRVPILALHIGAVLARQGHIHARQERRSITSSPVEVVVPHVRVVANSIP